MFVVFGFGIGIASRTITIVILGLSTASLNTWFDHIHWTSDLFKSIDQITEGNFGDIYLLDEVCNTTHMHYKQVHLHYFVAIKWYFVFDNSHIVDPNDEHLIEPEIEHDYVSILN